MSVTTLIIWIVLFAILAWCIYWHIKENSEITANSKKMMNEKDAAWLSRLAWSRSIQLFAALTCSILLIMLYSLKLDEAQITISTLSAQIQATPVQPAPVIASETPVQPVTIAQPAAVPDPVPAAAPEADVVQQISDQTFSGAAEPIPPAEEAITAGEGTNVNEVFKPGENTGDDETSMDSLKQRYEDILVTYYFLEKCKLAEKTDYYIIMAALSHDMASVNAPGRMQYDVITAARGSYDEIYAQSPCDSGDMQSLQTQYSDYIKVLSEYGNAR